MHEAVRRLRPDQAIEAAGYIRVSLERQADGHSPKVQREGIKRLAAQEGFVLPMMEEDHARGSKVTRAGYQRIIDAVRAGTIHAVIVFMFDRWGRDGAEWLARAREFERLGVPIISVQEGKDEGGLMRFVRAGMAEEFSRSLAKKVRPNREAGARTGTHMGGTPFGYRREYPPYVGGRRKPIGELVIDEATAPIVRELFARYAGGGWSVRDLARRLNEEGIAAPRGGRWGGQAILCILRNPVYAGQVRYNFRPHGLYESASREDVFVVGGRHEALIDGDTFGHVQKRLEKAGAVRSYNRDYQAPGRPPFLGTGVLRCPACGGVVIAHYTVRSSYGQYLCLARRDGRAACTGRGIKSELADDALLAEVRRLRGTPWTPQAEARLLGTSGPDGAQIARQQRQLEAERERLRKHTRLMGLLEDDPTPEQIASFREVSGEISVRIRALEAALSDHRGRAVMAPALRELHRRLTVTEIPFLVDALRAQGDHAGLRELLLGLVGEARIVERWPARHPVWARCEVVWDKDVQTLLDAGLLRLDPPRAIGMAEREARAAARQRQAALFAEALRRGEAARAGRANMQSV